jgi:hypothetical protein
MKFVINMLDMCMHCGVKNTHRLRGFLVAETLDEVIQHVRFAWRRTLGRRLRSVSRRRKRLSSYGLFRWFHGVWCVYEVTAVSAPA